MARPPRKQHKASSADVESSFSRGAELLAVPSDPNALAGGAALIEEAASDGHPEALAILATIEAIGAGRPQNFERAFDCLAHAAEGGCEFAQDQLRLLSGTGDESDRDWPAIRSRVFLQRLLAVPQRDALSDQPRIRVLPGFASRAECGWIIERARSKMAPAKIWDAVTGLGEVNSTRSNSALELWLTDMDVVTEVVRARISAAVRVPEPIFETPQLLHYTAGQEFKPHHDALDTAKPGHAADVARRGQRMATFLIYLNEEFEGGETNFPNAGLSYKGAAGDALFWINVLRDGKPDPLALHAGLPPASGEKWVFSQWIRDRPPTLQPA